MTHAPALLNERKGFDTPESLRTFVNTEFELGIFQPREDINRVLHSIAERYDSLNSSKPTTDAGKTTRNAKSYKGDSNDT